MSSFLDLLKKLNQLPEKARQFAMLSSQGIGLRNFLQKLLAIAQNGSVVAFFFFPLIQFIYSGIKLGIFVLDKRLVRFAQGDLFWKTG